MVSERLQCFGAVGVVISQVFCACTVLCALAGEVTAAESSEALWRVSVPVLDQGASARRRAERDAFSALLVRVTGRSSVPVLAGLRSAMRTPQRYYTSSAYERRDVRARLEDPENRPWLLVIDFDARSVTELLASEGLPVWTTRRPDLLVWMLYEEESGARRLMGADDPAGITLLERADARGLEVFLPALDLTDLASFSLAEAWIGDGDVLDRASRRYGSEYFFVLRIYPDPLGRWVADWQGEIAGEVVTGALEVDDPVAGAAAMLDAVADDLADRFAVSVTAGANGPGGAGELWLQVDEVDALDAYASLLRYLEDTDGVVDVQVVQFVGTSLLLKVDVADIASRLVDTFRLDGRLRTADGPEEVGGMAVWRARWKDGGR